MNECGPKYELYIGQGIIIPPNQYTTKKNISLYAYDGINSEFVTHKKGKIATVAYAISKGTTLSTMY